MENNRNIVVVVQARMGSSRLPGKMLMPILNEHVLGTLMARISPSKHQPKFIIATTDSALDTPIAQWAETHNFQTFRGSESDVLERFFLAVNQHASDAKIIVRICADNPLLNFNKVDEVIDAFISRNLDYLGNSSMDSQQIEDGFVVEVFSRAALDKAHESATLKSDREHVCPYMKKHLNAQTISTHQHYQYKLSVDTLADLTLVRQIMTTLGDSPDIGMNEIVRLLERNPALLEINKESVVNSGYLKSLKEDEE